MWDVKEPTHLSKSVGHEVSGVVAALFSKVAGSKYTCKRLRVYEATKKCELRSRGDFRVLKLITGYRRLNNHPKSQKQEQPFKQIIKTEDYEFDRKSTKNKLKKLHKWSK